MATVHITLSTVKNRANLTGTTMPVPDSVPFDVETLTSSGTSAQSTKVPTTLSQYWSVTASGGKVWVAFGANPTAASGAGWLVLDGQTRDFGVTVVGEKIAVKDA